MCRYMQRLVMSACVHVSFNASPNYKIYFTNKTEFIFPELPHIFNSRFSLSKQ